MVSISSGGNPFSSVYLFLPRIGPVVERVLQHGGLQCRHDSAGIRLCVLLVTFPLRSYFFLGLFAIAAFAYEVLGEAGFGGVIGLLEIWGVLEGPSCVGIHIHEFSMRVAEHSFGWRKRCLDGISDGGLEGGCGVVVAEWWWGSERTCDVALKKAVGEETAEGCTQSRVFVLSV